MTLDAGALICVGAPGGCLVDLGGEGDEGSDVVSHGCKTGDTQYARQPRAAMTEGGVYRATYTPSISQLVLPAVNRSSHEVGPDSVDLAYDSAWIMNAIWLGKKALGLLDVLDNQMLVIEATSGRKIGKILFPSGAPSLVAPIDSEIMGFVAGSERGAGIEGSLVFHRFDRAPNGVEISFSQDSLLPLAVDGGVLFSISDWAVGSESVLVFGDICHNHEGLSCVSRRSSSSWSAGFVEIPLGEDGSKVVPSRARVRYKLGIDSLVRKYYLLGHRGVTFAQGGFYSVLNEKGGGSILSFDSGGTGYLKTSMRDLVGEYPSPPEFRLSERGDYLIAYSLLEKRGYVSGAFSVGNQAYILVKGVKGDGGEPKTSWEIVPIGRSGNRIIELGSSQGLKTEAPFVLPIGGPDRLGILEKGPVTAIGSQAIKKLLIVRTSEIENG